MSRSTQLILLASVCFAAPLWLLFQLTDEKIQQLIVTSALIGVAGFFVTLYLVPRVAGKTQSRGICGKDLNKKGTPAGDIPIPEAAGLGVGCAFLLCIICFEYLHYYDINSLFNWVLSGFRGSPRLEIVSESWLVDFNAALATIGFMLFLGFADDVLDIRWRVKLLLPLFAALPLLTAYSGGTAIAVPKPVQAWFGLPTFLELGILYKVHMCERTARVCHTFVRPALVTLFSRLLLVTCRMRLAAALAHSHPMTIVCFSWVGMPHAAGVHGAAHHILHQQHQHPGRGEWAGGRPDVCSGVRHPHPQLVFHSGFCGQQHRGA